MDGPLESREDGSTRLSLSLSYLLFFRITIKKRQARFLKITFDLFLLILSVFPLVNFFEGKKNVYYSFFLFLF